MNNTLTTLRADRNALESKLTASLLSNKIQAEAMAFIDSLIASMEAQPNSEIVGYMNQNGVLHTLGYSWGPSDHLTPVYITAQPSESKAECWCTTCRPITMSDMRFVTCPDCGNKRCPKAHNHTLACTNSNEPGQPGSSWEGVKPASEPKSEPAHDDLTIAYMSGFHDGKKAKAEPVREPVKFLADGTRFKVTLTQRDCKLTNLPRELGGRWVAMVAAENDCHLAAAPQARKPLTKHEIHMALDKAGIETKGMTVNHEISIARAIEQAHGIEGGAAWNTSDGYLLRSLLQAGAT